MNDHCVDGVCRGDAGDGGSTFGAARCELAAILATVPCETGELDPHLADRLRRRVTFALKRLGQAEAAGESELAARRLRGADRVLEILLRRMRRWRPTKVTFECKTSLVGTVEHARGTVQEIAL